MSSDDESEALVKLGEIERALEMHSTPEEPPPSGVVEKDLNDIGDSLGDIRNELIDIRQELTYINQSSRHPRWPYFVIGCIVGGVIAIVGLVKFIG